MTTSLDKWENKIQIDRLHPKRFYFIGPVDPEIIVLRAIIKKDKEKKESNASIIYSPSDKSAERAKKIAQSMQDAFTRIDSLRRVQ